MTDPYKMVEQLVQRNISRMTSLLNSDATKRWFWSTLQAEGMFTITETITELQAVQEILDSDLSKYAHSSALDMYMTQLDLVWYKHKSHWSNWSNRQLSMMKDGGPIFGQQDATDGEQARQEEEDFLDTISFSGATAQEDIFDDMG